MTFNLWLLTAGTLLLAMGLLHPWVRRSPVSPAMLYLGVGLALGPWGWDVARIDARAHADWLHHAAELAVIISLFTVGLKLRLPILHRATWPALFLAFGAMTLTVALVAAVGVLGLGLPLGAAILFGAIVAPTDPVLASEVQMRDPHDRDRVRLTLTTEAGLNDGAAFPFVMLGLGLLGLHDLGAGFWRWWTIDVVWAIGGGLFIGAALGTLLGWLLLRFLALRQRPVEYGEYLVLGLIGVAYAVALEVHAYGFLSVFAAGLSLRGVERHYSPPGATEVKTTLPAGSLDEVRTTMASDPRVAPSYLAGVLLSTNEQLDHLLEITLVLLVGIALATAGFAAELLWFAPLLLLVLRPVAAAPLLLLRRLPRAEFSAIAWFGVRGVGSVYYLYYAVTKGLPEELAARLISLTLGLVAISIVVHGVSVSLWRRGRGD